MTQRVVNYTYGTGNPVLPDGSIDVRDGIDNLQSFDVFMNADEDTYNQRDGEIVRTVAGMNSEFDAQIINMGFTRIGTFASGATITNPRQTLLWDVADGGDGQEYGWSGEFPKVVPATSTPASTGGISVGAWIGRFDPELRIQVRESLRRSYAEAGYNLVDGSFEAGGTLVNANDVLLQERTGKALSGPAGTVAAGTNPASGGFVDRSQSLLRDAVMLNSGDIDQLGDDVSEINSELSMLQKAQDWGKVAMDSKVANDSRILVYRGSTFRRVFVLINHYLNRYQRWELTAGGGAGDGFDNAIPTNPNGNMWMVNKVDFVVAGPASKVLGSNPAMIRSGSTTIFGDDVRISSGYVETTVFGESVYLVYVARADGGIAKIYIDGALHSTLDQYNPSTGGVITLVKLADSLDNANHTVRIGASGTKNPLSSSTAIRVREITGVGLTDFTNQTAIESYSEPLPSGSQTFKIGNAAMELVIETVVNGSTVFSGAYHKHCYPRAANGHKLYIDGVATDFGSMVVDEILVATDLQMVQDLILSNVNTPIADVGMVHHFTSKGCNVKTNVTWTHPAQVRRSYQAMWPSTADRAILGGLQGQYRSYKSGSYINANQPYHNALAYHSVDGWVSGFYSNNEYGMRFTSSNPNYKGMYIWDRTTDFKIYLRKSSGVVAVGEKWNSDVTFTIGHCPDAARKFDFEFLN